METKTCDPAEMGWEQCTFAGSERAQLIVWSRLPIRERLEALEQMCDHARETIAWRQREGLPYFDPENGELIKPRKSSTC
jgi:hypothetical protein